MKNLKIATFTRDKILATFLVSITVWLLSATTGVNVFEPGKHDFSDFDYTDRVFAEKSIGGLDNDHKIVIINIGDTTRAGIAAVVNEVSRFKPKAIGIDVVFNGPKDRYSDSLLADAIVRRDNVILASEKNADVFLRRHASKMGFAVFYGESNVDVVRSFPFVYHGDTCFAGAVLSVADPEKFEILQNRKNAEEIINYEHDQKNYFTIECRDVLAGKVSGTAFEGKIVLLGYVGTSTTNIEDKHFTPLNHQTIGRSLPDMNGVVIQANVLSMMLTENYIEVLPHWFNSIWAFVACFLFVSLSIRKIQLHSKWFHVFIKFWQAVAVFCLSQVDIFLLAGTHIRLDSRPAALFIIFAAEVLFLYAIIAEYLNRTIGFKTIFGNNHSLGGYKMGSK